MPDLNEQLRAVGVSRDAESPSGKGVLVSFNRAPTDDELRTLHDQLRQHGSAAQAVAFSDAGRDCMGEDECIAAGVRFADYERGVSDAIEACERIALSRLNGEKK